MDTVSQGVDTSQPGYFFRSSPLFFENGWGSKPGPRGGLLVTMEPASTENLAEKGTETESKGITKRTDD